MDYVLKKEIEMIEEEYKDRPRKKNIEIRKATENYERIMNAPDKLPYEYTIQLQWYKNQTWGYCPKGSDNYGNVVGGITGCGFCKTSTATACLLNQMDIILKRMYLLKNQPENNERSNREIFGYGSGYTHKPRFEGGVGFESHQKILERLGFNVNHYSTNTSDTIIINEGNE